MSQETLDTEHMKAALGLARRNLGSTASNPSVGCVIVQPEHNRVIARGWTAEGGRPHAETQALARAGDAATGATATGATAYVTLEPCAHDGQTPPCATALMNAGIARVVVGIGDPDPRTAGKGIAALRKAGVEVCEGVCAAEAREMNLGFFSVVLRGRPLVTLKLATSLDGRIATHTGDSKWITGKAARAAGHLLRAEHDAILVGSNTALVDDPDLTCRIEGLEYRSPVRVVADGRLRLPLTSKLVVTAKATPTCILTSAKGPKERRKAFKDLGVDLIDVPETPGQGLHMDKALEALAARGITRLLVEGGSRLAGSLIAHHLVDRVVWFRAPLILGGDGRAALEALGVDKVADGVRLKRLSSEDIGADVTEIYEIEGATDGLFALK